MSDWDDFPRRVGEANAYALGWRPRVSDDPSDTRRGSRIVYQVIQMIHLIHRKAVSGRII